jgi:hypothetical protein
VPARLRVTLQDLVDGALLIAPVGTSLRRDVVVFLKVLSAADAPLISAS